MRLFWIVSVLVGAAVSPAASECSAELRALRYCDHEASLREQVARADRVFVGTVEGAEPSSCPSQQVCVRLEVTEAFKGGQSPVILTTAAWWKVSLEQGKSYLFFTDLLMDGRSHRRPCGPAILEVSAAERWVNALRLGEPDIDPVPGDDDELRDLPCIIEAPPDS